MSKFKIVTVIDKKDGSHWWELRGRHWFFIWYVIADYRTLHEAQLALSHVATADIVWP